MSSSSNDNFGVMPTKPAGCCARPSKCDPCGAACMMICGTKNPSLTCRPGGRNWGRACGPMMFKSGKWMPPVPENDVRRCMPVKIYGKKIKRLPYGFGLYARKLYPYGLPCMGSFILPKPSANNCFYPMLPTKPGRIYSRYTFNTRGAPYTCPRPCIAWLTEVNKSWRWQQFLMLVLVTRLGGHWDVNVGKVAS